jgi:hypothetical protein
VIAGAQPTEKERLLTRIQRGRVRRMNETYTRMRGILRLPRYGTI